MVARQRSDRIRSEKSVLFTYFVWTPVIRREEFDTGHAKDPTRWEYQIWRWEYHVEFDLVSTCEGEYYDNIPNSEEPNMCTTRLPSSSLVRYQNDETMKDGSDLIVATGRFNCQLLQPTAIYFGDRTTNTCWAKRGSAAECLGGVPERDRFARRGRRWQDIAI